LFYSLPKTSRLPPYWSSCFWIFRWIIFCIIQKKEKGWFMPRFALLFNGVWSSSSPGQLSWWMLPNYTPRGVVALALGGNPNYYLESAKEKKNPVPRLRFLRTRRLYKPLWTKISRVREREREKKSGKGFVALSQRC
jgi:hypothetical protein